MGKTAAKKKTTITKSDPQQYLTVFDVKQRFIGEALGLGWRLIIVFLLPVVMGVWADHRLGSKPSYTLVGIFIAIAASVVVIKQTVKEVNEDTEAMTKKGKKHA